MVKLKQLRIKNFRGIENLILDLDNDVIILTGINNVGKTSILKALQIIFGNSSFISKEDFFINHDKHSEEIIIDVLIIPYNKDEFEEEIIELFTSDKIQTDGEKEFIPLRVKITFNDLTGNFEKKYFILEKWENDNWLEIDGEEKNFNYKEIPFFYISPQRDILEDIRLKNSYLGKMLAQVEYDEKIISEIEDNIKKLNDSIVENNDILTSIKNNLEHLNQTIDKKTSIEITPLTKKIRDLNKGLTIYYGDDKNTFSMEYHGMGTRSWSSILSFKTFLEVLSKKSENEQKLFYPIIAIEEPETHLHPNAQKQIYNQLKLFPGIKIVTTHSPYIVTSAKLNEIRNIYKIKGNIFAGNLLSLRTEEERKIKYKVIATRGELIFSKCIVLFEGETEEIVLPILFKKYFNNESYELGINFIGVNGYGQYVPFIKFAENLNIPFLIFSDNDKPNGNDIKSNVIKQVKKCSNKNLNDIIVFLNDGNDFEKELIETEGYEIIIKNAILNSIEYVNENHREAKFEDDKKEIFNKSKEEILDDMRKNKTKYAFYIANEIIKNDIELPQKVIELFEKIKKIIG